MNPYIVDGKLHAPYFIFIRNQQALPDLQLLTELGLNGYTPGCGEPPQACRSVFILDDGTWTHVADDFCYTMWHMKQVRQNVARLGHEHELFSFSVGDTDYSFEIEYWKHGVLRRRFVYDEPPGAKARITHSSGTAFPAESKIALGKEALPVLWEIAGSLGIQTDYSTLQIRTYSKEGRGD